MSDKRSTVAVATYADEDACDTDYTAVRSIKTGGQLDHIAIAKVHKDADGKLEKAFEAADA